MTTLKPSTVSHNPTLAAIPWFNRGLEALWLLTVVLVPVVFFRPENFLSEAIIAYVEAPKIALLRTVVGLMTILWLVEWGVQGKLPFNFRQREHSLKFQPRAWCASLAGWLQGQPTRWVILAVWFFLGTTVLSTLLSASFDVSLWGEIPGQDGFAAYNIVAYILLFGVIVTHLKTPAQLWRLLGAIVVVGVLVSGYAVLQHYGHDFLGVLEATGGGRARVTSIMGNAVFAGAAMLMPIAITLLLATVSLSKLSATAGRQPELRRKLILLAVLGLWVAVMAVQFLGIIFTFSRGPWLGTLLALAGFLVLVGLFVGWRTWGWSALVVGPVAGVVWWVLQGSGFGWFGAGPWAGAIVALAGILALVAILGGLGFLGMGARRLESARGQTRLPTWSNPRVVTWAPLAVGLVAAAGLAVVIAVSLFNDDNFVLGDGPSPPSRSTSAVQQRFASISDEVLSGGFSGRGLHWQDSWRLARDRPWFEFDTLGLPWLRPVIGYGPDLFRYTYLLESSPQGGNLLPTEPDNAHNFFIHQAVEQGLLGLLSSLGLFGAVFAAGSYQLFRKKSEYSDSHKLVLIGLLAVMAGRFVEQIVGLARVSDLTIFWALLAAFVVLPKVMQPPVATGQAAQRQNAPAPPRRDRRRSRSRSRSATQTYDWQRLVMLAIVAWVIGGIIALTWVKTVNYPRAGIAAADAVERFQRGDFQGAVADLDRANDLAPDVPVYYSFKSSVWAAYLQNPEVPPAPECSPGRDGTSYEVCLGQKIYQSNLAAVQQRPFYWRSRLALANSALALGLHDEAIRLYREVVALVPASWPLHNRLAEAYIDAGQPELALQVLERSLAITKDSSASSEARRLQELATEKLSNLEGSTSPVP